MGWQSVGRVSKPLLLNAKHKLILQWLHGRSQCVLGRATPLQSQCVHGGA